MEKKLAQGKEFSMILPNLGNLMIARTQSEESPFVFYPIDNEIVGAPYLTEAFNFHRFSAKMKRKDNLSTCEAYAKKLRFYILKSWLLEGKDPDEIKFNHDTDQMDRLPKLRNIPTPPERKSSSRPYNREERRQMKKQERLEKHMFETDFTKESAISYLQEGFKTMGELLRQTIIPHWLDETAQSPFFALKEWLSIQDPETLDALTTRFQFFQQPKDFKKLDNNRGMI